MESKVTLRQRLLRHKMKPKSFDVRIYKHIHFEMAHNTPITRVLGRKAYQLEKVVMVDVADLPAIQADSISLT